MTDFERVVKTVAPQARSRATETAKNIGSPWAGGGNRADQLGYYRGVLAGDGPETPDEARKRMGDVAYAEMLTEVNRDARRQNRG